MKDWGERHWLQCLQALAVRRIELEQGSGNVDSMLGGCNVCEMRVGRAGRKEERLSLKTRA